MRSFRGQVIFFVEGTRTLTGELQEFKKGAFHFAVGNHLPVLPTAIRGSFAALAKRPWWRLQPGNEIEVLFCPPIEVPAGEYADAVEGLRGSTRMVIARSRSVEVTAMFVAVGAVLLVISALCSVLWFNRVL